jgi:hypothetical protein
MIAQLQSPVITMVVRSCKKALRWVLLAVQILALVLLPALQVQGAAPAEEEQADLSLPPVFTSQSVENAKFFHWMGDRTLRIDSNTRPHIVYGGDHLYYAYHNGTAWQFEKVDPQAGVGKYASLFVDKNNKPHAAYYDARSGSLKYARKTTGVWEVFVVDANPNPAAAGAALLASGEDDTLPEVGSLDRDWHYTLPGSGNPYDEEVEIPVGEILPGEPYLEEGMGEVIELEEEIQPAPEDDPEDTAVTLAEGQVVNEKGRGQFTSIAVNSYGSVFISYYDLANGNLRFASLIGSTWNTFTIDTTGDVGLYTSMALDSIESPHISYYDATKGNLKYTRWTGNAWSMPVVIDNGGDTTTSTKYVGLYSSIAIDKNNNPHISYYDEDLGNLKYARANSGIWTSSVVDSAGTVGLHSSLRVDKDLKVHISYYNDTAADLKYATCTGGSCTLQTVAADGYQGRFASLALDGVSPRITYYDSGTGQLKYAYPSGATWAIQILDGSADLGLFSSLALDGNGNPRIAYFDDVRDNLKYAYWDAGSWKIATVDQTGEVGLYASLALNKTNGYPSISYYDSTNGRLKIATWIGTSWWIEIPDSGSFAGMHSALALDSNGNPRIVYCKGKGCATKNANDPMEVKVALKINNQWIIRTVESGGVGLYSSIALDSQNVIHLSYYDAVNRRLRYARGNADGLSWTPQTADGNLKVGLFTSIAVDSSNRPHIAYFDDINDRLRYSFWNGGWYNEIADPEYGSGWDPSLAIDGAGNPHISYHNMGREQLKYAVRRNGVWSNQVVDSDGSVGLYSSIRLKGGTAPVISYYDATSGDLKYASTVSGHRVFLPLTRR